jgi:hypothetical protein
MSLLNEVIMGTCSEVYHYLLNKIRYIEKNQSDNAQKHEILLDVASNKPQIVMCALSHRRGARTVFKTLILFKITARGQ